LDLGFHYEDSDYNALGSLIWVVEVSNADYIFYNEIGSNNLYDPRK
jgi:hypothetical protein